MLDPHIAKRLRQRHIRIEASDADTLVLRDVPADRHCFDKPYTNLMIIRPQAGLPYLICVDEDLHYTGQDGFLSRAFAGASVQQGWRVLHLASDSRKDFQQVLDYALRALGFDPADAASPPIPLKPDRQSDAGGLLASLGTDLSCRVRDGLADPTIGRAEEITRITASLLGWRARLVVVVGIPGVGKSNLLQAVAGSLNARRAQLRLVSVNLGTMMAGTLFEPEREKLLAALLREAAHAGDVVLALECLELAAIDVPCGRLLLAEALEQGLRLIGISLPDAPWISSNTPLSRWTDMVKLEELSLASSLEVLRALREKIEKHHGVRAGDSALDAAVKRSADLAGCLPAKAIMLLDAAAARARLAGSEEVEPIHVYLAASDLPEA